MKCLLIGGTGTLGHALTERLSPENQVTVFSRGELAQKQLKAKFPDAKCRIGDVRDEAAVRRAVQGMDAVFLLAAIKHVDVAQENPLEAFKTNFLGAVNVGEACLSVGVPHVVYSNTDKAVLPITTYGYTKALAQDYLLSLNGGKTKFSSFLWGNVLASRGSVIQTFVEKILRHEVLPVTDGRMTRFWLTMDQAADFMLENYVTASTTKAMIPPVKAASVRRVIDAIARLLQEDKYQIAFTGHRGVEKLHEVLESTHEGCLRSDTCDQYTDDELGHLLAPIVRRLALEFDKTFDRGKPRNNGAKVSGDLSLPRDRATRLRPRRPAATA